jgi:hypothetical protein
MAPERRWACPRRPAGGPGRSVELGGGRTSSPLVGLLLFNAVPPGRISPPMNSLPPRLCPWDGFEGDTGGAARAWGECGGVDSLAGFGVPAGLNEKSGRALMDFCLWCGMDPLRPAGYACRDIGRELAGAGAEEAVSGSRMGKENSGLGRSSMGPAFD